MAYPSPDSEGPQVVLGNKHYADLEYAGSTGPSAWYGWPSTADQRGRTDLWPSKTYLLGYDDCPYYLDRNCWHCLGYPRNDPFEA
jgi:hypothetical protein